MERVNTSPHAWIGLLNGRISHRTATRVQLQACKPHYVYVLCRADGTPFYVGKGVGSRVFHHEAEARTTERLTHKLNLIRACARRGEPIGYCIESSFTEEADAHARERELIALFGRHDLGLGPLTNQTDGGEGVSNPSEESRERRRQNLWGEQAEDEERRAANRFFQHICAVQSVPVKPLSRFKPERLFANREKFAMSRRQAAALAASAIANRILLDAGACLPRLLTVNGVPMAIENGVGRDILSSQMADLAGGSPGSENLRLTDSGFKFVKSALNKELLLGAGILLPTLEDEPSMAR